MTATRLLALGRSWLPRVAATVLAAALAASCGGAGAPQACPDCVAGDAGDGTQAADSDSDSDDATAVAGGVGSGGTGIDGDGVGSGGTGQSAEAVGIGSVDGFGSIVVNGIRHAIDAATLDIAAPGGLQLGMTVRVRGRIDSSRGEGAATAVSSAPELRGLVAQPEADGSFSLLGARVSVDPSTAWAGLGGPADLAEGMPVLAYALPGAAGHLRATRVERLASVPSPVLTGTVQDLRADAKRFRLGEQHVDFADARFAPGLPQTALAEGLLVRVTATALPLPGTALVAAMVEPWHPRPVGEAQPLSLAGLVTDHAGGTRFRLLGVEVDAAGATVTGGPAQAVGNGVRLEASGVVRQGVLVAQRLALRHGPGMGGPVQFSARGAVGQFVGVQDFRVQGQPIDASGNAVRFVGGSAADLRNGRRVSVTGSRVGDGMLLADEVRFEP